MWIVKVLCAFYYVLLILWLQLQVFIINATNPDSGLQRFCQRVSGVQYFLEHNRGFFYVLTNAQTSKCNKFSGSGYYLARCEVEGAQSANLKVSFIYSLGLCYLPDACCYSGLFLPISAFCFPRIS